MQRSIACLVMVVWCACATTNSTCPAGRKLVTSTAPAGRTDLCVATDALLTSMPVPGRGFESSLSIGQPPAVPGGADGPYTSWYPGGSLHAHGGYVDLGGRSVPNGVWAFWYPSGKRRTLGAYHRGEPVGCFAVWDETGALSTGFATGSELRVATCEPPSDRGMLILEGQASEPEPGAPTADVSIMGFTGAASMGARNAEQIVPRPTLAVAFDVTARKAFGRFFVGPTLAIRTSNDADYTAYAGGAIVAYPLPRLHPRIGEEVSGELAALYIQATAMKPRQIGQDSLHFWSLLPGARLTFSFQLSPYIDFVAGVRVEGLPLRDSHRTVNYCDGILGCLAPREETWRVGGFGVGANAGLRLLFR